jgi:hypothetical protein
VEVKWGHQAQIRICYNLHDGSLLSGKNQVADVAGILKKIGSWILNFRLIILDQHGQHI